MTARVQRRTPYSEDDWRQIYEIATADEISYRWILRGRGVRPAFEEFCDALAHNTFFQQVAVTSTSTVLCHLIAYEPDFRNRHVAVAIAAAPKFVGTGAAILQLAGFCGAVFQLADFRKLYAEMLDINFATLRSGEGKLFEIEGCLREHEYVNGQYHDVYLIAIYPSHVERWAEQFDRWTRRHGSYQ